MRQRFRELYGSVKKAWISQGVSYERFSPQAIIRLAPNETVILADLGHRSSLVLGC